MDARIEEAARHITVVSRVETVALETKREPGAPREDPRGCCICDAALRGHDSPRLADATHVFAAYQAERLGGRYVYVCPHGLLHIAAPVLVNEVIDAILVCGPAVLGPVDEEAVRAICESRVGSLLPRQAISAWLDTLPALAPAEATSLSYALRAVALALCDEEGVAGLRRSADDAAAIAPKTSGGEPDLRVAAYLEHLETMEGELQAGPRYPVETERELLDRVSAGDRDRACELLDELTRTVTANASGGSEEVRSRVLELVVLLSRAAIAGGADAEEVFGLEYRSLVRLRSLGSVDAVVGWLNRILRRFVDLVFDLRHVRYSAHLSRALGYAREHFRDPIQLSDAAEAAGVSPGYLGRIIRSELHTTWSRHLTTIRVQEAKRLLRVTNLSVGEVGSRSGFPDQSYFAQVFRRETGVPPSEYRAGRTAAGAREP